MDPDTCLQNILTKLAAGTPKKGAFARDGLIENLNDLAEWVDKGGFYPKVEPAHVAEFEGIAADNDEPLTGTKIWVTK